jgi:succinate dehydrogenase / fumarate reductase cytochrome b subunit
MSESATTLAKKRPEFRNINAFTDLPSYRLPAAGWVSILHRVSGALMFVLMPFIIWMFDTSISSEISFARFTSAFNVGMLGLPGFVWKLVALALIWAYLHHFTAGLRHLWMDVSHKAVELQFGKNSAKTVLAISLSLTVVLAAKLFGVY